MGILFKDEWLVAEGSESGREYIVHTQHPRFVMEMCRYPDGTYESGQFEYFDECLDVVLLARLARQAGLVFARYDDESG
ncbi:MAG: hypothetical protein CEE38_14465 [Planctomycetes bacterium B3_Pla]|nr:MAG: hypothetical protein CEE38_14465 [Planctomycetes bacterium B3_Pla]